MHSAVSTELQFIRPNINREEKQNNNYDRNNIFNKLSPKRQSLPSTSLYVYITSCINNTYATFLMLNRTGNAQKQCE